MSKTAIFISDMHLGSSDELEDFIPQNEDALVRFLGKHSADLAGQEVDLIILGDGFDIWQVASMAEKEAADSSAIGISIDSGEQVARARQIVAAHKKSTDALQAFLRTVPAGKLYIVTGNHDHSLIDAGVRDVIKQAVTGGDSSLNTRVLFTNYYDNPELQTYAEHGNQFDLNNEYEQFTSFGDECPGYYFVRLFWNRMEHLEPNMDIWFKSFRSIWKCKVWKLIIPAYRFFKQYRTDSRSFKRIDLPGVPFFAAGEALTSMPVTGEKLPEFPDLLFSEVGDPEFIFSRDTALENRLRSMYHDPENAEFKKAVDEILKDKFKGQPPSVPQPHPVPMEFGIMPDRYVTAVAGMFAPAGEQPKTPLMKGDALTEGIYKYVLLGHTHDDKKQKLKGLDVTYFNTGTWSVQRDEGGKKKSRLCYVLIQKHADGSVTANQSLWKG